jgi:putative ABC transport system ATP-binding protein
MIRGERDSGLCVPTHFPPANTEPAVSCRNVIKEFGQGEDRVQALRGIDVEVQAGELTLLVGPSGCGKTTLLSVITGLLEPTSGEVRVLGTDLFRLPGRKQVAFRGKHIGFVFQQYNLLPALTATENAAVPLLIAGMPRQEAVAQAAEWLAAFGMAERAQALPSQLSGGQQQRVAIARALIHEPRLLVCDEPTAALDAHSGQAIMEVIRRVAVQPGRAVLVVTHDNRVFSFGDRIVQMNDGRIVQVETPACATEPPSAARPARNRPCRGLCVSRTPAPLGGGKR